MTRTNAARQAAQDLPPDEQERFVQRAMKRCSREKWLVKSQQDKADAVVTSPRALSANVRKGADVLNEVMAEDSRETRIGLSAAARKAAETFGKMPGSKVIKHAQAHRHMTSSASQLHRWDDEGNPVPFTLNVLNLGNLEVEKRRGIQEIGKEIVDMGGKGSGRPERAPRDNGGRYDTGPSKSCLLIIALVAALSSSIAGIIYFFT